MTNIKSKSHNGLTINVRTAIKNCTDLNVSADTMREIRELSEDMFIPLLIRFAETEAKNGGKRTIQEQDYLVAKDYVMSALRSYGMI